MTKMNYITLNKTLILETTLTLKKFPKRGRKGKCYLYTRKTINAEGIIKTENQYFITNTVNNWFRQEPRIDAWMQKALGERIGREEDVHRIWKHHPTKLLVTKVQGHFIMEKVSQNHHNQVTDSASPVILKANITLAQMWCIQKTPGDLYRQVVFLQRKFV